MSKRPALPQYGDRKKPKLDISRSDHHLPLSQNICTIVKEDNCDVWGDDDEEQMLLQASQACEEEQNNDISMLPDYSNWKQPGSTSTQYQSSPSTSKTTFEFKKPNSFLPNAISTHLKNKCNTISSPLPGISTMTRDRNSNLTDDLAISDKIMSGQDDICRRMLLLEEENNKLKSEYQKLYDKIFTKEGEASILRSQLKASQLANDNARMEKIRAQEKVQMECNEKLAAITKEMQNLKAQLEFKDLEILSVKDKFKKLEANKLRLTQVNEISSHRNNNTLNNTMTQQKAKMTSNSVQTEDKAPFVKLNKSIGKGVIKAEPQNSFSTHPTGKVTFNSTTGVMQHKLETPEDVQLQLISDARRELVKLEAELRAGAGFAGVDERSPAPLLAVRCPQLFDARALFGAERGGGARRAVLALGGALVSADAARRLRHAESDHENGPTVFASALRVCELVGKNSCGALYSGFLMSLIIMFDSLLYAADSHKRHINTFMPKIVSVTKAVLLSKPMPFVTMELLMFVRRISTMKDFWPSFCPGARSDAMDVDSENGDPDTCYFAILLKQSEDVLSVIKAQGCGPSARLALRSLIGLFKDISDKYRGESSSRCECQQLAAAALARALREAVEILVRAKSNYRQSSAPWVKELQAACRSCVELLNGCAVRDAAWLARLARSEGLLSDALHRLHQCEPSLTDVTELRNMLQAPPEDAPVSYLKQPFMASFADFSMTD